jgi:hypothetical protein
MDPVNRDELMDWRNDVHSDGDMTAYDVAGDTELSHCAVDQANQPARFFGLWESMSCLSHRRLTTSAAQEAHVAQFGTGVNKDSLLR